MDFGTDSKLDIADAGKKRKRGKSRKAKRRCHVESVRIPGRGTRFMLVCENKRPKFISAQRAKAFRKGR
jgi:hypothetical protein